jgi:hypothetical protein
MGSGTVLITRRRQTQTPRPDSESTILLPRHLNPALPPKYPNLPSRPPRIQILLFPTRYLRRKVWLPRRFRSNPPHCRDLSHPPCLRNNRTNSRDGNKEVCRVPLGGRSFVVSGDGKGNGKETGERCYVYCFYSSTYS